jgi:hypothetical protein
MQSSIYSSPRACTVSANNSHNLSQVLRKRQMCGRVNFERLGENHARALFYGEILKKYLCPILGNGGSIIHANMNIHRSHNNKQSKLLLYTKVLYLHITYFSIFSSIFFGVPKISIKRGTNASFIFKLITRILLYLIRLRSQKVL